MIDRDYLKEIGYEDSDMPQIEEASRVCKCSVVVDFNDDELFVTPSQARSFLGDRAFSSGVARSAFHRTAIREVKNGLYVYFDASALFKSA